MKYWAFISYAHADNRQENRRWADWLQERLESFTVPPQLVGTEGRFGAIPERIYPVFQDDKELPTSSDLGTAIDEALRESRVLIVLCSPNSARSHWVNEEVLAFKRLGREGNIIAAILWGEPGASAGKQGFSTNDECFPEGLRYKLGADGEVDRDAPAEPIASDLRDPESGAQSFLNEQGMQAHFEREFLRITAGVLGVGFETLVQRNVERERREAKARRMRRVLVVALAALTVLGALIGVTSYLDSQRERRVSLERKFDSAMARSVEGRARRNFEAGWKGLQEARSLGAELGGRERDLTMEAYAYLTSTRHPLGVLRSPGADGEILVGISLHDRSHSALLVEMPSGDLVEHDLFTHAEKRRIPVVGAPEGWEATFRICHGPPDGEPTTIAVAGDDGGLLFLDYATGEVKVRHDFPGGVSGMRANWEAGLLAVTVAAQKFLRLYRLSDGSEVAVVAAEGDETMEGWQASWLDKRRVAVACNDGACRIINLEGETEQVLRPEDDLGSFLSVCATSDRIVAGTAHGELVFWSRSGWNYEGQVKLAASEEVLSIRKVADGVGVEPDRHLAVLTLQGTLAWIDPVGRRIVDRFAVGGSPRMNLAISKSGVLYATGRLADAWVHRSRPDQRWRFPGASNWDLDGWEVHGRDGCVVGCAESSDRLVILGHGGGRTGEGWGVETSLPEEAEEASGVERVHLDPRDPRRMLVLRPGEVQEIELGAGRVVARYSIPEADEEAGSVVGMAFAPEGGIVLFRSVGGLVHWQDAATGPEVLESGWEKIKAVLPVPGERAYLVSGGDQAVATLRWDAEGRPSLEDLSLGGEEGVLGLTQSDRGPCAVLSASGGEAVELLFLDAGGAVVASREVPLEVRTLLSVTGKSMLPLAISERAGLLARAGGRGIQLYDLTSGRLVHQFGDLEGLVGRLAFFGPRDALVYEVGLSGIGNDERLQAVWDWREGELLLSDGLETLKTLPVDLSPEVLPRYFMARGLPGKAIEAVARLEGNHRDGLLDPRSASRYGVEVLLADERLEPEEEPLVAYVRRQAEINQEQFLRSIEPAEGNDLFDWGASRVARRVLGLQQEELDQFPEDLPALLALLETRTAYQRGGTEAPLLRGLLLARKPEPDRLAAVRFLELAFARLPDRMEGERSGAAENECRHLVTAARLHDDWRAGEATPEREALLAFVGGNFDRFLQQYYHYRDASWGDSLPYVEGGRTHESVEDLGRFTIDYNLALAHRTPTLELCRALLLDAVAGREDRPALVLAGVVADGFNFLADEDRDRMEPGEIEKVLTTAAEVLEASAIVEDPFLSALRALLLVAEREIRLGRNDAALRVLDTLAEPSARALDALPDNRDLPGLAAHITTLKLRIARLEGKPERQTTLLEEGIDLLSPGDDQPAEARVRRYAQAGRLARETAEVVETAGDKVLCFGMAAASTGIAFRLNEAAFLKKKAERDGQENTFSSSYNAAVRAYRKHLEAHVDSCQWLGSTYLDAGLKDEAVEAYRRANDALMDVLNAGVFSQQARRDLVWHRLWTLKRIASIELDVRPDAPASHRALLTWENAAAAEARGEENPETRVVFNWVDAVDRIAASTDRALLEKAVKAYGTLIDIVDDLEFENPEEEDLRQRILIVGHFNRAFLCREHRIRGIDIVGTLETTLALLEDYDADPGEGSWAHEMYRKVLTELEREYRGDGETANEERLRKRLEDFGGALE